MKSLWIIGIVILIAGGSAGAYWFYQGHDKTTVSTLPADTSPYKAMRSDMVQSVASTGTVASNLDVVMKCLAGGPE